MIQVISIVLCKDITAILLQSGKLRHGAGIWMDPARAELENISLFPKFPIHSVTLKEFLTFSASKKGCRPNSQCPLALITEKYV